MIFADAVNGILTITVTGGSDNPLVSQIPANPTITVTTGPQGLPGVGVPVGGTTGQVLAKNSGTNYDTGWVDQSGGGGGGAVDDAIVDGVTDRAPSQNAVFDALAGRAPKGANIYWLVAGGDYTTAQQVNDAVAPYVSLILVGPGSWGNVTNPTPGVTWKALNTVQGDKPLLGTFTIAMTTGTASQNLFEFDGIYMRGLFQDNSVAPSRVRFYDGQVVDDQNNSTPPLSFIGGAGSPSMYFVRSRVGADLGTGTIFKASGSGGFVKFIDPEFFGRDQAYDVGFSTAGVVTVTFDRDSMEYSESGVSIGKTGSGCLSVHTNSFVRNLGANGSGLEVAAGGFVICNRVFFDLPTGTGYNVKGAGTLLYSYVTFNDSVGSVHNNSMDPALTLRPYMGTGIRQKEIEVAKIKSAIGDDISLVPGSNLSGVVIGPEGATNLRVDVRSSPGTLADEYALIQTVGGNNSGRTFWGFADTHEFAAGGFFSSYPIAADPTPYGSNTAWYPKAADDFPRFKNSTHGAKKLWGNVKILPLTIADLSVGLKLETLRIKTAIKILGWDIISDASGSCVIDIVSAAGLPTGADSIMGGNKPTLSSAQSNSATGLSIVVAANNYLRAEVESASIVSKVTIMLHYREDE